MIKEMQAQAAEKTTPTKAEVDAGLPAFMDFSVRLCPAVEGNDKACERITDAMIEAVSRMAEDYPGLRLYINTGTRLWAPVEAPIYGR